MSRRRKRRGVGGHPKSATKVITSRSPHKQQPDQRSASAKRRRARLLRIARGTISTALYAIVSFIVQYFLDHHNR